jgi:hypothetical protein
LLKLFLQVSIGGGELIIALSQSLGFQGMEDFPVVDSGDEAIGNGADGFVKVHLGGECVEGSLGQEWQVLRGNGSLDWV